MKALTWQGKRDVRVESVPDPMIQEPTDAIVKITSTAICGSDLHRYEVLGAYLQAGDVLGHEPMGIVQHLPDPPGGPVVACCGQPHPPFRRRVAGAPERRDGSHRVRPKRRLVLEAKGWPFGETRVLVQIEEAGDDACDVSIVEDAVKGPGVLAPPAVRQPLIAVRNREALTRLALIAEGRRRQGLSAP